MVDLIEDNQYSIRLSTPIIFSSEQSLSTYVSLTAQTSLQKIDSSIP